MKNKWYGDNRDLVKWGVLLRVALRYNVKRILHVTYFRQSQWGKLVIDGTNITIPKAVLKHFRDVRNISTLSISPRIQVMTEPFVDRKQYTKKVVKVIRDRSESEKNIVFLDSDTDSESRNPGMQHVLESELAEIWGQMFPGDILVFYQHQTNRNGDLWIESKRKRFEKAPGLPRVASKFAHSS